jgi:hypothetical protein
LSESLHPVDRWGAQSASTDTRQALNLIGFNWV